MIGPLPLGSESLDSKCREKWVVRRRNAIGEGFAMNWVTCHLELQPAIIITARMERDGSLILPYFLA